MLDPTSTLFLIVYFGLLGGFGGYFDLETSFLGDC
jgi:hypothetical protein